MVRCTKRSATGLHTLSMSVQHHVRVVNTPSAERLRWRFQDQRKAGDQSVICRRHSDHCKHARRAARTRQPSTQCSDDSLNATQCQED